MQSQLLCALTEKIFLNLVKSNQIWIVIRLFPSIWHRKKFHLVSNQSKSVITINIVYELERFRNYFSVCAQEKTVQTSHVSLKSLVRASTVFYATVFYVRAIIKFWTNLISILKHSPKTYLHARPLRAFVAQWKNADCKPTISSRQMQL